MKRNAVVAVTLALTFALATPILGQTADPPKAGEALRKLSKRERKARLTKLEVRFQDFLSDVEPLLAPLETDQFLLLETDAQRDSFIEDFWRKREALAGTRGPTQTFKDVYYERLAIAKERFRDVASDRSKMYLVHGAPAAVARTECQRILQPTEVWIYPELPGLGQNVRILFYKPRSFNDFKLWNPLGGSLALAELMSPESGATGPAGAADASNRRAPTEVVSASPYSYVNRIQIECPNGDEVLKAITQMIQVRVDLLRLFDPSRGDEEHTRQLLRSAVIVNPNAPKLTADFSVRYPTKDGSRTDVQMMLLVPRGELSPAEVGGAEVYTIDVVGEVLKEGKLWEKYRYRFDFPAETKGEHLPVVIDRLLRPNQYTSRIKVVDANGGGEAVVERELDVPEIFVSVAAVEAPHPDPLPVGGEKGPVPAPIPPRLKLIPPPGEIVSGIQTFDTIIEGDGVKGVEFWLDGKKLAVRRAAPFALDIDLGEIPQMRRVRAVAIDAAGKPLVGDDIQVNSGTEPFRVRIASPRVAPNVSGPTRVEIDVRVPDGEELGRVELFWNERRVATLYDPPFVQTVDIPATDGVGYLRAVASLQDGTVPPLEDVVMINTPAYMEELDVHLIELPTTVLIGGKPSNKFTEKDFKVLDDGKPVTLSKFEFVKNLPLSIGMAIDTSGSMQPIMEEAQKAGAQFFQKILKKGDKAFLLAFDERPQMVQAWSTKLADMHAGLAKLRAEETTSLYDAVIESLYNFQGVRGQKALVLISDGKDTASKFSFDQALEYARRSAVPIYAIAIGLKGTEIDVRHKLQKLCSETGGTVYQIERALDLEKIYADIQAELRSQYVLGFYPPADVKAGGKWREIEVKVSEGKARTIRGYYP